MRLHSRRSVVLFVLLLAMNAPCLASRIPFATERLKLSNYSVWSVGKNDRGCWSVFVRDPDGYMYHLQLGDYIGQEDGKVDKIDEAGMEVVEIVTTPGGQFAERRIRMDLVPERRSLPPEYRGFRQQCNEGSSWEVSSSMRCDWEGPAFV
jgi:hypothetical protein